MSATKVAIPGVKGDGLNGVDEILGDARNTTAVNWCPIAVTWEFTFTPKAMPFTLPRKNAVIGNRNRAVHGSIVGSIVWSIEVGCNSRWH